MISDATLKRVLPPSTVALTGDLIRGLAWGLVAILWLAYLQVYVRMGRLTLADPAGSDFTIFYYTVRMVADGLPMYGTSPARYGIAWQADHLGNLNPPHFQLLLLPLASLSYAHAYLVWAAVSIACLEASMALVFRELRIAPTWKRLLVWGAFTIGLAPFTTVAVTGELTFVLLLPATLLWRAWRRGEWRAAGAWLGVCASLKLFFLLFVPLLVLRRRWASLSALAASVAAIVAIGSLVFGLDTYRLWLQSFERVGWWWMAMNASWHGLISRFFESGGAIVPVWRAPPVVAPLALTGSVAIAAATLLAVWRTGDTSSERDRAVSLLLVGAVLASPLGWVYYLPLAWGPVLAWMGAGSGWQGFRNLGRTGRLALVGAIVLLYLPQEVANSGQPSRLATLTLASGYFWATITLWLAMLSSGGDRARSLLCIGRSGNRSESRI